jgi:tetratricopeptide (TPR) repeat protein
MSVIATYDSRRSGAPFGLGSESRSAGNRLAPALSRLLTIASVLFLSLWASWGAESNLPPPIPSQLEGTNLQQILQACLRIQEQLQAAQLALEQNRQETKEASAQNAEALSNRLQTLQETLSTQRAQDLEAAQRSNKVMLLVAGTFGALGFLVLLVIACLQWRTGKTLAEISAALPVAMGLGAGSGLGALGPADQSNRRLLGALEQLDKRLHQFKQAVSPGGNGDFTRGSNHGSADAGSEASQAGDPARISLRLSEAQAMLSADNPAAALACCDEVLSLNPNHPEALVKKGAALERLHRLNEAIECYDQAIAADGSMTLAYLHKGGLCNRLERFKEALECYGKALLTHGQRGA